MDKQRNFKEIYTAHKDKIYRLCSIIIYDKAQTEDLFQEVLINIWKGLENFQKQSKIETWIYRIVANTAINLNLKARRNHKKLESFKTFSKTGQTNTDNNEMLFDKISHLKSADRILIGLYLEGYQYKEIAKILGMTTSNVGVKLNRIKGQLKSLFNQN